MAKFKVDTDEISRTISNYETAIEDINSAIKEAEDAIEVLKKSGWKTKASETFFDNFDSSWKSNINKRIQVIKHLKECLVEAKNDYDKLCEEASGLVNTI